MAKVEGVRNKMSNIHCKYDKLVDPKKLKDHPKNRNKHADDQIERLAKLYEYHGIRHPIIVSENTGMIVAGHGRKLAAIRAGIKQFPVVVQSFENSEAEYAFIQSDNAIANWAELDFSAINTDLADLGPDFELDMLGIKNFNLDAWESNIPPYEKVDAGKHNLKILINCDEDALEDVRGDVEKFLKKLGVEFKLVT